MANNANEKKLVQSSSFWKSTGPAKTSTPQQQPVGFIFKAPDAYDVSVAGSFNQWIPGKFKLVREGSGTWKGSFLLKPGVYEYRYYVNGQWVDDPNAKKAVVNAFGTKNAILEVK